MTWSKIHTSTIVTNTDAALAKDQTNHYEKWNEIFTWFTGRGWTVTEQTGNSNANQYNFWNLTKDVTTYEGLIATYSFHLKLYIDSSNYSNLYWLNGKMGGLETITSASTTLGSFTGSILPNNGGGVTEWWQSDLDNDSYLLVSRLDSGNCYVRGFWPGEKSLRYADSQTSATYPPLTISLYPIFFAEQARTLSNDRETRFGFTQVLTNNNSAPVITHGRLDYNEESYPVATMLQADVSMLEDYRFALDEWNPHSNGTNRTVIIDGTYYIALGSGSGTTVGLLNCGLVDPNINV